MNSERNDIYTRVTNQIIEAIEKGQSQWRMPWHVTEENCFFPTNAVTKHAYRGVNVLALWATADALGYPVGLWATYKQWQELGAQVRKEEKGTAVVFWKVAEGREEESEQGSEEGCDRQKMFARAYWVFNVAQVDGYEPEPIRKLSEKERIEEADAFFVDLGANIQHGGSRAFYDAIADHIQMPPFESFKEAIGYYAVLAHEATHWSAAGHRLDRVLTDRFKSEAYAVEELIAELGAAFLCASLGLSVTPRPDHAAYVADWLRVLKADKRAVFTAAAKAQQAADWMQSCVAKFRQAA